MDHAMLILSRNLGESIMIGPDIEIAVVDVRGKQVKIGIRAPREIDVHRKEVAQRIADEQVRTLRPGVDYDPDAVCPGCGNFRDRCACDLRETPAQPVKVNISGTARIDVVKAFKRLAQENSDSDLKKN